MQHTDFVSKVIDAFKKIHREIDKGSSEYDVRYRFVKYFVEGVLGYEPKYIKWEKKHTDLTIVDENNFSVIKIETKKPTIEDIDNPKHEEQAFKYAEETTRYIGLTNFKRLKFWEIKNGSKELRVDLNFSKILERKPLKLLGEEKSQILFLSNLRKGALFDPSKYERFNESYARIDITEERGFKKLLERLDFITNELLLSYVLRAFGEYKEAYDSYRRELRSIEETKSTNQRKELNHDIIKYQQKLEEKYSKYKPFSGFYPWKEYSGKEEVPDDKVKEIFCKESIYVLLNKLLFIRICEDKGILEKNISNGGVEELRVHLKKMFDENTVTKELLELAFKSAKRLYPHFYETGILDWFRTGDGELNEILNKVLWTFNQFDFTHVDRDILGNLYEKYLPKEERKKLGEFYTPVEVIDYILTSIGYTYSHEIENKDLLDPACGSGGFLVRATRRLISRFLIKFGKADKKELRDPKNWKEILSRLSSDEAKILLEAVQEHIHGLDINPFACHIAEMNMLFQIVDLYQKVREKYKNYKLKRFTIYRTNSLELPMEQYNLFDYESKSFLEEQQEIDEIKKKKFDFVVGNPPYIRVHHMAKHDKEYMKNNYVSPKGDFDIYIVFLERGLIWLKKHGLLGFINSNKYLVREYGRNIRAFILNNAEIPQIVDVSNCQIFRSAAIYPIINIFIKKTDKTIKNLGIENKFKRNIEVFFIRDEGLELLKNTPHYLRKHPKVVYSTIDQSMFYDAPGYVMEIHITPDIRKILEEMEKDSIPLGKLSDNFCGTPRSKDYHAWGDHLFNKKPEIKESCKYIVCANVSPYRIKWGVPIRSIGKRLTTAYLEFDKKLLTDKKWQLFKTKNKIIIRGNAVRLTGVLDEEGFAGVGVYFLVNLKIEPKYLLGIINSDLMTFYYTSKLASAHVSGRYISINGVHLEKLPIKVPRTPEEKQIANQIIKKVDEILELNKKISPLQIEGLLEGQKTTKLYSSPSVTFSIKDSAKLKSVRIEDDKLFINSEDYAQIKNKKLLDFVVAYLHAKFGEWKKAKDVKSLIYNINTPESKELLNEIIKRGSKDVKTVKERIKKLEKEIDELVYQLYEIKSDKEKKIIKESLK